MIHASEIRVASEAATAVVQSEILAILSVQAFKDEHRITHSVEDDRIEEAIKEAYAWLDGPRGYMNRAILTQTWKGVIDDFDDVIEIPTPPLQSVDSIRYRDEDGNWQTLATTIYGVDSYGLFGRVFLKKDQEWPDVYEDPGSVEITWTAGYGTGAEVVTKRPAYRKALKLLGGHYYFNPTPTFVEPRLVEVPRKIQFGLEHVLSRELIRNDHQ